MCTMDGNSPGLCFSLSYIIFSPSSETQVEEHQPTLLALELVLENDRGLGTDKCDDRAGGGEIWYCIDCLWMKVLIKINSKKKHLLNYLHKKKRQYYLANGAMWRHADGNEEEKWDSWGVGEEKQKPRPFSSLAHIQVLWFFLLECLYKNL